MAIQPIDLSVIYSQMDNVAKFNASQNQLVQAANQDGRDRTAAENLEKSKTVQNAANDEEEANSIKKDLDQGGGTFGYGTGSNRKKKEKEDEEKDAVKASEFSDPRLGRIIDITG